MRSAAYGTPSLRAMVLAAAAFALVGCERIPGRPGPGPEVVRPNEVLDFSDAV